MKSESLVGILWVTISNEFKNRRYPSVHRASRLRGKEEMRREFGFLRKRVD
ncbi:hypothetical protein Hanom_Chr02g00133231 [Helianthus anomalus]